MMTATELKPLPVSLPESIAARATVRQGRVLSDPPITRWFLWNVGPTTPTERTWLRDNGFIYSRTRSWSLDEVLAPTAPATPLKLEEMWPFYAENAWEVAALKRGDESYVRGLWAVYELPSYSGGWKGLVCAGNVHNDKHAAERYAKTFHPSDRVPAEQRMREWYAAVADQGRNVKLIFEGRIILETRKDSR